MTDATTSPSSNYSLDVMALGASPSPTRNGRSESAGGGGGGSWFEALATAWGQSLDQEAGRLETMSDSIGNGQEEPSQIALLSAESLRMSFLSQSENTSLSSVGQSLQTMARKD